MASLKRVFVSLNIILPRLRFVRVLARELKFADDVLRELIRVLLLVEVPVGQAECPAEPFWPDEQLD